MKERHFHLERIQPAGNKSFFASVHSFFSTKISNFMQTLRSPRRVHQGKELRSLVEATVKEAASDEQVAPVVNYIVDALATNQQPMIVGGFLRDAVLSKVYGRKRSFVDLDIIVFGVPEGDFLVEVLHEKLVRQTTFGGVKLDVDGIPVDVWRAELQAEVSGASIPGIKPTEFIKFITLTTNSVGYDIVNDRMVEHGFIQSIHDRVIELGERTKWLPQWAPYHLAHLAYTRCLTGFSLGRSAALQVLDSASNSGVVDEATRYLRSNKSVKHPERVMRQTLDDAESSVKMVDAH